METRNFWPARIWKTNGSAGLLNCRLGGAGRYEDALRELREKYEEEVQKAEKRYLKDGELYEQQRSDALKRSTEIQRQVRELSPFRDKRERYEDLSATEFIEALHGMRPIPESYLQAKEISKFASASTRWGRWEYQRSF